MTNIDDVQYKWCYECHDFKKVNGMWCPDCGERVTYNFYSKEEVRYERETRNQEFCRDHYKFYPANSKCPICKKRK